MRYLSISDFAEYAGLALETVRTYGKQGRLPEPDVLIGLGERAVRGWSTDTIDAWLSSRPGRGHRRED